MYLSKKQIAALEMALEALESCQGVYLYGDYSVTADTIVEMLNSGRKEQQKRKRTDNKVK